MRRKNKSFNRRTLVGLVAVAAVALAGALTLATRTPVVISKSLKAEPFGHIIALEFSTDNKSIYSATSFRWKASNGEQGLDGAGLVTKWDIASGTSVCSKRYRIPTALAASPDSRILAVGTAYWDSPQPASIPQAPTDFDDFGGVHLVDANSLNEVGNIDLNRGVIGLAFIPNTSFLAVYCVGSDNHPWIYLVDVDTKKQIAGVELTGKSPAIEYLGAINLISHCEANGGSILALNSVGATDNQFSSQGHFIFEDGEPASTHAKPTTTELLFFDIPSLAMKRRVEVCKGHATFLDVGGDGRLVAVVDQTCVVGDVGELQGGIDSMLRCGSGSAAAFVLPDDNQLLTFYQRPQQRGSTNDVGRLIECRRSHFSQIADLRSPRLNRILFAATISNDRTQAAVAGNDGSVQVWCLGDVESEGDN